MRYKKYSWQSTFFRMHCSTNTVAEHAYTMPKPYDKPLIKQVWQRRSTPETQTWNTEVMLLQFTNLPISHS